MHKEETELLITINNLLRNNYQYFGTGFGKLQEANQIESIVIFNPAYMKYAIIFSSLEKGPTNFRL